MKKLSAVAIVAGVIAAGHFCGVYADFAVALVPAGTSPCAVAVNPVTNKTYVANSSGNSVTIIDAANASSVTIPVGMGPSAIAVNPVTNKIYVANTSSNNVTIIDGATNTTAGMTGVQGAGPVAIAVNTVTNRIYVTDSISNNVAIIDGATNACIGAVGAGATPVELAVNPMTNKIYVTNMNSDNVTIIDGATNATAFIGVGSEPRAIAVNPVTNKIYVANYNSDFVTVIDGLTNATMPIAVGITSISVAVNPATNKIYMTNYLPDSNIRIIDGATNSIDTVSVGWNPRAIAVNPVTNKIYFATIGGNSVTVLNGADNSTTTVGAGTGPIAIAVNPVTNKIFAANNTSNDVTVIDGSSNSTAAVSAGTNPNSIGLNPVTNKIYIANGTSNDVTVIDGLTNSTTTVSVGTNPYAIVVNPVTNKIYVTNQGSNNVTVIDGETNSTATVSVDSLPSSIAVNVVTNKIYVANCRSNNVTVIDGLTNATTMVGVQSYPIGIAVNQVTNKIYVTNYSSNTVTVIDGVTNATTTFSAGYKPYKIAVNPVTNKIYLTNNDLFDNNIRVIDGVTNSVQVVNARQWNPIAIAVNPVTNKIYFANIGSSTITIIDGATNFPDTMVGGANPWAIAVNPVTNKVFVANQTSNDITIIDGATNSTTTIGAGAMPSAIAVNPVTNTIYAPNLNSNNVTVLTEAPVNDTKVWAILDSMPGNSCSVSKPVLTGKAVNRAFSGQCGIQGVFDRLNSAQIRWNWAPITSMAGTDSVRWNWNWGTTDSLISGENFLCLYAADSQSGTTNNLGMGTSFTGNLTVYPIYYLGGGGGGGTPNGTQIPRLSSPGNGSNNMQTMGLTLFWDGAPGGGSDYIAQVSMASDFSSTVFAFNELTAPFAPLPQLANNTWYFWRVNATDTMGTSDWSSVWSFSTGGNGGQQQEFTHFMFDSGTGNDMTVLVRTSAQLSIGGEPIQNGDEIGVFNHDGRCVGAAKWTWMHNMVLSVYGDDPISPDTDGMPVGESMQFRVWDSSRAREFPATVTYDPTHPPATTGSEYQIDGIAVLSSLTVALNSQMIMCNYRWNMKSLNIRSMDSSTLAVFGSGNGFLLVKDRMGSVYCPSMQLYNLSTVQTGQGYQIYTSSPYMFQVQGLAIDVSTTPIFCMSGWNMIAYLPESNMPPWEALGGLGQSMLFAKNNTGRVFWPSEGISSIDTMRVGEGYKLYMLSSNMLYYPSPGVISKQIAGGREVLSLPEVRHYALELNTGTSATVLAPKVTIAGSAAPDCSEIGAFDEHGNLVGAGTVIHGRAAFSIWGDDPQTKQKDGALAAEKISFTLWDGSQELPLDFIPDNGSAASYSTDGLLKGSFVVSTAALIKKFDLSRAYPNPFRGSVRIAYDVPAIRGASEQTVEISVFDMKGSLVKQLVKGSFRAGHYEAAWTMGGGVTGAAGSTVYIVRMKAAAFEKRIRIIGLR